MGLNIGDLPKNLAVLPTFDYFMIKFWLKWLELLLKFLVGFKSFDRSLANSVGQIRIFLLTIEILREINFG